MGFSSLQFRTFGSAAGPKVHNKAQIVKVNLRIVNPVLHWLCVKLVFLFDMFRYGIDIFEILVLLSRGLGPPSLGI